MKDTDIIIIPPPKPMSIDVYKLNGGFVTHTPMVVTELQPVFRDGAYVGIKDTMDEIRQRIIKESIYK